MTPLRTVYHGGSIYDGRTLHHDACACFENNRLVSLSTSMPEGDRVDMQGDILSLGYADLQVNGGDGILLGDAPSVAALRRISQAHRALGATLILPTLITDTPDVTRAVIAATIQAVQSGVPGLAGLHLEGPHLSHIRKGAHDHALIRPMTADDLQILLEAAKSLPKLKVTLAPENVSLDQVRQLTAAGVLVSLGHTDADFETCISYAKAGARCVTHLFNAMSPLTSRAPGLVGAALTTGALSAGMIADGIHVHPQTLRAAWRAKVGPGALFLVSDAMAVAGSSATTFQLGNRKILRQNGQLTLKDGTLAGADLDLTTAVRVLTTQADIALEEALCAAITTPRQVIDVPSAVRGQPADAFIRIDANLQRATPLVP